MLIKKDKNYIIDNYDNTFKQDFAKDQLKPAFILINDLNSYGNIYSYVEDDKEIGYCYLCVNNNFCLIDYVAIHKKYRRLGYGKKLIKEIFELYNESEIIFLETEADDIKKLKFYKSSNVKISDIKIKLFGVDYLICTRDEILDKKEFKEKLKSIYKYLYRHMYEKEFYIYE